MLKAKIFENETLVDPVSPLGRRLLFAETGTPQGGILSPMLANVALTTLDNFCEKYGKRSNPLIRYADDFVVTCRSDQRGDSGNAGRKDRLDVI